MKMTRTNLTTFTYQLGFRPIGFTGGADIGWIDRHHRQLRRRGRRAKGERDAQGDDRGSSRRRSRPGLGYLDRMTATYDNHAFRSSWI